MLQRHNLFSYGRSINDVSVLRGKLTLRREMILIFIGCLITGVLGQYCPADRRIDGFTCGGGSGSTECPSGSQCVTDAGRGSRYCCWEETSPAAAPCEDPLVQNSIFTTCTPGQDSTCPGSCYSCDRLGSEAMNMGLCCPQVTRPGCENSSPALVAFENARRRIVGSRGGTSSQGGDFRTQDTMDSQGSRDMGGFQSATDMPGSQMMRQRETPTFSSHSRIPAMPEAQPTRPMSPCGGDIRPTGYCVMAPFPRCPMGQRCVGIGFARGVCCPVVPGMGMSPFIPAGIGPGSPRGF